MQVTELVTCKCINKKMVNERGSHCIVQVQEVNYEWFIVTKGFHVRGAILHLPYLFFLN